MWRSLFATRQCPYPGNFIPLWSLEGLERLERSIGPFQKVAENTEAQGPLQCGVTSLTIALNVCRARGEGRFTVRSLQEQFREALKPANRFFSTSLEEIWALAQYYASAETVYASETTSDAFSRLASETLEVGGCVIANFSRSELGYESSFAGHCSPLAAYDPIANEFLVMDVAQKSWQPVWVPADVLFRGMDTIDKPRDDRIRGSKTRGFILIDPCDCAPRLVASVWN